MGDGRERREGERERELLYCSIYIFCIHGVNGTFSNNCLWLIRKKDPKRDYVQRLGRCQLWWVGIVTFRSIRCVFLHVPNRTFLLARLFKELEPWLSRFFFAAASCWVSFGKVVYFATLMLVPFSQQWTLIMRGAAVSRRRDLYCIHISLERSCRLGSSSGKETWEEHIGICIISGSAQRNLVLFGLSSWE